MFSTRRTLLGSAVALVAFAALASGQQGAGSPGPHTIVINLVEQAGPKPFAFQPAEFTAHYGDTLRFVQQANTMHNVHIKTEPKGAKLGSAATSDYLTAKGQAYTIVVDRRFVAGAYEIVCDPHDMVGMHATLTVAAPATVTAAK